MPELPEVETVRQSLRRKIIGKRIKEVELLYETIIKTDKNEFKERIKNQQINEVGRFGKYLFLQLTDYVLISHLRMEGKYFLRPIGTKRDKHDHVIFTFDDGTELRYNDVRKFGTMHLKSYEEAYSGEPIEKLGFEPFDAKFTLDYMKKRFNCKRPIKNVLLDQTIIVGLGNIYVDEVLFLSRIHPLTLACDLKESELEAIKEASVEVLNKAIALGGTTIRSYYSDDAISGLFQNELRVHQKEGEHCENCDTTIIKIKVGGRGTYYCPNCQST